MSSIQHFEQDGIEIFINSLTQEAFTSVKGYARMSNKDKSTISRRLQGVAENQRKIVEVLTGGGLQGVASISEDLITEWLPSDNPEMTKKFLKWGVRGFLHKLAGYQEAKNQPVKQEPVYLPSIVQFEKVLQMTKEYKELFGEPNPTMLQLLKDHAGNALMDTKQLKASESDEQWLGVVNYARIEFGFTCPKSGEFRDTALGKWIVWYYPEIAKKQEYRLCNETQQEVNVYPIHEVGEQLKMAVKAFIDHPNPGSQLRIDGAFKRKPQ